jgi:hypothetical protein
MFNKINWLACCASVAGVALFVSPSAGAAENSFVVRSVDTSSWEKAGDISFLADVWVDGVPGGSSASADWSLDFDGGENAVSSRVEPFRKTDRNTAVLVLVPATAGFVETLRRRRPPIEYVLEGIKSLRNSVGNSDYFSVGCYGESGGDPVALSGGMKTAARVQIPDYQSVAGLCRFDSAGMGMRLPTILSGVIKDWLSRRPGMSRYVVVVVTDGNSVERISRDWWKGLLPEKQDGVWLELLVAGFEDGGEPSGIEALADGGVLASAAVREDLPDALASLGPAVSGSALQKVVFPIGSRKIPGGARMHLRMRTAGGEVVSGAVSVGQLVSRPGAFKRLMPWLAVVAACVVVAFILTFFLISRFSRKGWSRASVKRSAEEGIPYIVAVAGCCTGQVFCLDADDHLVGTSRGCDIRVRDKSVAERHCFITVEGKTIVVEDLCNGAGVLLNNRRIRRACVRGGDVISLGNTELLIKLPVSEAGPTRSVRQP